MSRKNGLTVAEHVNMATALYLARELMMAALIKTTRAYANGSTQVRALDRGLKCLGLARSELDNAFSREHGSMRSPYYGKPEPTWPADEKDGGE
ncbi:MAG: hypothetical protein ABI551_20930 [Polyangiaceae bacterium]